MASQGGVIRLYDCSDHSTERWRLSSQRIGNGVFWAIVDVDFAGNKEWLAYSSWSPKIQVVNVKSEAKTEIEMDTGSTRRSCLFGIRFSPDSKKILAGSSAGDLFLMDLETQELVVDKPGAHGDDLNSVAFISDNPEVFATAGDDRICKIWDQRCQDECVGVFVGHKLGLTCVSSRVDGRFLLTNGKDHCMKLWDMRQMSPANTRALSPSLPEHDYRFFQFQRPSDIRSRRRLFDVDFLPPELRGKDLYILDAVRVGYSSTIF